MGVAGSWELSTKINQKWVWLGAGGYEHYDQPKEGVTGSWGLMRVVQQSKREP